MRIAKWNKTAKDVETSSLLPHGKHLQIFINQKGEIDLKKFSHILTQEEKWQKDWLIVICCTASLPVLLYVCGLSYFLKSSYDAVRPYWLPCRIPTSEKQKRF